MRLTVLLPLLFAFATAHAAAPPAVPRIHNLAGEFAAVWERNQVDPAARVQDFHRSVTARFPAFYGIERYAGKATQAQMDARIEAAFAAFPAQREGYLRKVHRFAADLPQHIASFKAWFPDYVPAQDIYLVHSLGEMDGGKRTLGGRQYFVFGADVMLRVHGEGDEAAFFHHELFHDHHERTMGLCGDSIADALWTEGLATYVAKRMHPGASDAELLLNLPEGMMAGTQAQMGRAWAHLQEAIESNDLGAYAGLFSREGDATGMPARRGYYLGYLVAEEAGRTRDLRQLAALDCKAAQALMLATVRDLRERAAR